MNTQAKNFFFTLAALCLMVAPLSFAQDDHAGDTITQGEAALLLAQRLSYNIEASHPLAAHQAIKVLTENRITPFGGWDAAAPLMEHDLARILVLALGFIDEIPEEERENPETTAYRDYLVRDHNLDLSSLSAALDGVRGSRQNVGSGLAESDASSDPLRTRGQGGEVGGSAGGAPFGAFIPTSEAVVAAALEAIIPTPGAGRRLSPAPRETVSDTTPSEPS
ncbi:MAG: hypothetical protein JJU29_08525 [Verrucomicrobia bacterium]|nr:hypothetical protein [Verrucomicrobiota bacterium]